MSPFEPLIRNAHLATIASNFWPRYRELEQFPERAVRYETEPGVAVLVHEQRPEGRCRGELVLVHGLEGSSAGGYMLSMAYTALRAGFAVHRVNIRGCGGTESWCRTLYHAGLTSDLHRILESIGGRAEGPILLMGYSLGGNVVLKLTGEGGPQRATVAVSTPLDLHACVRALGRPQCFLYQNRFINRMRERLRERARLHPEVFAPLAERAERERIRTVFDFDDRITAPFFGFGDAANYYETQSAVHYLGRVTTPVLLITAQDDPLVPFAIYGHPAIGANPRIELVAPRHGGHVSFLAKGKPRFWLDAAALGWLENYGNK